ncbi:prepilin-type N-terminal cleavage/methylation domain-containing protein [bacterium]|nr:prepilin-type N-terminal cleavage/methylation domain-containing protein [bacterium]
MNKNAFSLIELIISITIIAILGTILYPNFSKLQQKAKESSLQSTGRSIQTAIELYALNNTTYPSGTNIPLLELIDTLKTGGELTKIPKNPFTGKQYTDQDHSGNIVYNYDETENQYTLNIYGSGNKTIIYCLENI